MPTITANVSCEVPDSFRVAQVAGMFDLPRAETCRESFSVETPGLDEPWTVGAIVGPSGSGKSTVAREAFPEALCEAARWPADKAVIDGFGDLPIRQIAHTLTAVGFSSPPSWIKPYHVLSNGERFRCDLARALLTEKPLVVFDEFTSVVDRTVARIGSAAVSRAIRKGRIARRFVAVTCHYDVLEWLEPDWVVDMASGKLTRGRLRRPQIALEVVRCKHAAWRLFARHHYLSGTLTPFAHCYMALWQGQPAAFCAVMHQYGFANRRRITRIVTLPDYQGVGIGARLLEYVCRREKDSGQRVSITSSHPAIIGYCKGSPRWRTTRVAKVGQRRNQTKGEKVLRAAQGRCVVSFEFKDEVLSTKDETPSLQRCP